MKELTEAERAYRRGALQAVQFLKREILDSDVAMDRDSILKLVARYELELIAARVSRAREYLGVYMDEVSRIIRMREAADGGA